MKICNTCGTKYGDVFNYCPADSSRLEAIPVGRSLGAIPRSEPIKEPHNNNHPVQTEMPKRETQPLNRARYFRRLEPGQLSQLTQQSQPQPSYRTQIESTADKVDGNAREPVPIRPRRSIQFERDDAKINNRQSQSHNPQSHLPPETIQDDIKIGFMLSQEPLLLRLLRSMGSFIGEFLSNPGAFLRQTFASTSDNGLEQSSLPVRLLRGIENAVSEFLHDPRAFILQTFARDAEGRKRKRLLRAGISIAVGTYAIIFVSISVLHLDRPSVTQADSNDEIVKIANIAPLSPIQPIKAPKAEKKASGGGGGGAREKTPPSRGRLPIASLTPPIVAPTTKPSPIEQPSLPVAPTIQVQPELVPPQPTNMPLGLPTGVVGPPSDGPGSGKGIGSGKGGGVGSGDGTGLGPGKGYNTGGGEPGLGGGDGGVPDVKPVLISLPKPRYTEEARREKIQGAVVLSVLFSRDGVVRDIRVIRGLGYGLDEQAIIAAQQIKFKPGMRGGQPISVRQKIQVEFRLL